MEQMMKDGIIGAVFDYALGEISDELYNGLRASGPERLTVEPNTVPEAYRDHAHVFHNPIILAPRLNAEEMRTVAREITKRLTSTKGNACFMVPKLGSSRYAIEGGPLHDRASDEAFLQELKAHLPEHIELIERDMQAEDPAFVREAVNRLIAMIPATSP
jgi:uncharacterized protein (UPF0261 family)